MKLPERDLEEIFRTAPEDCLLLKEKRILLTGGTGFIGTWFLGLFDFLNRTRKAGIECFVPSRNPLSFRARHPELGGPWLTVFEGDVRSFPSPEGRFDVAIHAATDVGSVGMALDYGEILDVCVGGTRRVVDFLREKAVSQALFLSSGAVYGRQDPLVPHQRVNAPADLDPTAPVSAYGEGKRVAEWLMAEASRTQGFHLGLARCYAFSGPGLPLDGPFAAGNFLGDALAGRPIVVKGDGTPLRSYLYASDMVVWLLAVLQRGQTRRPYHVGSDIPVSIAQVAQSVARFPRNPVPVEICGVAQAGQVPARYVPSVEESRKDLGVEVCVSWEDGLRRHWNWLQEAQS